ncbi:MAG TPA: hypothetical protein DCY00_07450, partial [Actinobacteria bacterium]|nr:hypothetical protein [Actinomycetota bacterium]
NVSLDTELDEDFWVILKTVEKRYCWQFTGIHTNSDYWDCECDKEYIHRREEQDCKLCGKLREDCPASRVNEIKPENIYKG